VTAVNVLLVFLLLSFLGLLFGFLFLIVFSLLFLGLFLCLLRFRGLAALLLDVLLVVLGKEEVDNSSIDPDDCSHDVRKDCMGLSIVVFCLVAVSSSKVDSAPWAAGRVDCPEKCEQEGKEHTDEGVVVANHGNKEEGEVVRVHEEGEGHRDKLSSSDTVRPESGEDGGSETAGWESVPHPEERNGANRAVAEESEPVD